MKQMNNRLLSFSREKYLKFRSRLERKMDTGQFKQLSRKKKKALIDRVEKFGERIQPSGFSKQSAMIAGSVAAAVVPAAVNAQTQNELFFKKSQGFFYRSGTQYVKVANIDDDADLEIIASTGYYGGMIIDDAKYKNGGRFDRRLPSILGDMNQEFVLGDIDGDDDLDIMYVDNSDFFYAAINDGSGEFSFVDASSSSPDPIGNGLSLNDFQLVDLDGDDDLDLVTSTNGYDLNVFLNNGNGEFGELTPLAFGVEDSEAKEFEFADLDGDGDLDLVISVYQNATPLAAKVIAVENSSNGNELPTFLDADVVELESYSNGFFNFENVTLFDADGDGDLDVFFSKYFYGAYIKENTFVDGDTELSFGDLTEDLNYSFQFGYIYDVDVADFDNDGDDELLLTNYYATVIGDFDEDTDTFTDENGYLGSLYSNDGGDIGEVSRYFSEIAVGDVDGDGNTDFIAVNTGYDNQYLYLNRSAGFIGDFSGGLILDENTPVGTRVVGVTDTDGGIPTVQITGDNASFFSFDATEGAVVTAAELDWESIGSELLLNLDISDGTNTNADFASININNLPEKGHLIIEEEGSPLFGAGTSSFFTSGDIDFDGDQDLMRNSDSYNYTYWNSTIHSQYDGAFLTRGFYSEEVKSGSFIDLDSDGDLDFVAEKYGYLTSFRNDLEDGENVRFDYFQYIDYTGSFSFAKVIEGDIDNDDKTEVVRFGRNGINSNVSLFEVETNGELTEQQDFRLNGSGGLLEGISTAVDIAVADFDGDGFDDLVVVTADGDDVLIGGGVDIDGDAIGFADTYSIINTVDDLGFAYGNNYNLSAVETGDFDGDGNSDLAIQRFATEENQSIEIDIHLGNGDGTFTLGSTVSTDAYYVQDIEFGDIDGDGTLDMVTSFYYQDDSYDFNYQFAVNVFANDGDGSFTLSQEFEVGGFHMELMDADADDDLDIIVSDFVIDDEEERTEASLLSVKALKVYKNVNLAPTDIELSASSFDEHLAIDTEVAIISVTDPNPNDDHDFLLVEGDGGVDEHNSFFSISGNSLSITKDVSFEDIEELNINLAAFDSEGNFFTKAFTFSINDIDEGDEPLSILDEIDNVLGIYPNPGTDFIQLNVENDVFGSINGKVIDLSGRLITSFESDKNGQQWSQSIDMSFAESGVYMVEVFINELKLVQRWIKE